MRTSPRLLGATVDKAPVYAPTDSNWDAVEKRIGKPLSPVERERLVAICDNYLLDATAEAASPTVKEVLKSAARLRECVNSLLGELKFRDDVDPRHNDALSELKTFVDEAMRSAGDELHPTTHAWAVVQRLGEGVAKAEASLADLAKDGGLIRAASSAWIAWIGAMAAYWEELGMRATASKASGAGTADSPFVCFVRQTQATLPAHHKHVLSGHFSDEVARALGRTKQVSKAGEVKAE